MISVVLMLVVVGIILWLINTYIPMQPPIPAIINIVVVICVILWLVQLSGIAGAGFFRPLR